MPTHLKKITLTVLPLVGLLFTAPLTFAYDSRREHGRAYNELTQEHQQGHQALAAEARANGYYHATRARRYEQRRLRREHRGFIGTPMPSTRTITMGTGTLAD
jgi:hypothetical protein